MPHEKTSDAPAAEAPPAKPRKIIKIADVKGRKRYGNPFQTPFGFDVRLTHPTNDDIQKAIDDGYLVDRPFSGNQQALLDEWCAASSGGADRAKFIEIATRWHAGRIAYLVKEGIKDPIGINQDYTIHDGQHRLIAAEFRGDTEIEAVIG
jgi:hypothetical protein